MRRWITSRWQTLIVLIALSLASSAAFGTVFQLMVTGAVVDVGTRLGVIPSNGDTFSLTLSYDDAVPDSIPQPDIGLFLGALERIDLRIGTYSVIGNAGAISISHLSSYDIDFTIDVQNGFGTLTGPSLSGLPPTFFELFLSSSAPTVFASADTLPSPDVVVQLQSARELFLGFGDGIDATIVARVDNVVQGIPEPGSLALVAPLLVAGALWRRRAIEGVTDAPPRVLVGSAYANMVRSDGYWSIGQAIGANGLAVFTS